MPELFTISLFVVWEDQWRGELYFPGVLSPPSTCPGPPLAFAPPAPVETIDPSLYAITPFFLSLGQLAFGKAMLHR